MIEKVFLWDIDNVTAWLTKLLPIFEIKGRFKALQNIGVNDINDIQTSFELYKVNLFPYHCKNSSEYVFNWLTVGVNKQRKIEISKDYKSFAFTIVGNDNFIEFLNSEKMLPYHTLRVQVQRFEMTQWGSYHHFVLIKCGDMKWYVIESSLKMIRLQQSIELLKNSKEQSEFTKHYLFGQPELINSYESFDKEYMQYLNDDKAQNKVEFHIYEASKKQPHDWYWKNI